MTVTPISPNPHPEEVKKKPQTSKLSQDSDDASDSPPPPSSSSAAAAPKSPANPMDDSFDFDTYTSTLSAAPGPSSQNAALQAARSVRSVLAAKKRPREDNGHRGQEPLTVEVRG